MTKDHLSATAISRKVLKKPVKSVVLLEQKGAYYTTATPFLKEP